MKTLTLEQEYSNFKTLYGEDYMSIMFGDLNGYKVVRDMNSYKDIKDELSSLDEIYE
tara:strand:+ start:187 stop:357 length:171 start_codon:yes stop_codon:yes gene_type:complete